MITYRYQSVDITGPTSNVNNERFLAALTKIEDLINAFHSPGQMLLPCETDSGEYKINKVCIDTLHDEFRFFCERKNTDHKIQYIFLEMDGRLLNWID